MKKDIEVSKEASTAQNDVHLLREKETNLIIENLKKEEKKLILKNALMKDDLQLLSSVQFDNNAKDIKIEKLKLEARTQMVRKFKNFTLFITNYTVLLDIKIICICSNEQILRDCDLFVLNKYI